MTLDQWHRLYLGVGVLATLLALVGTGAIFAVLGAFWEMRRDPRGLALGLVTVLMSCVMLVPVVAFWPVALVAMGVGWWRERRRRNGER